MCAKIEKHEPISMVTMYRLMGEFSDFGRNCGHPVNIT
jgi:hypothetical protein